MTFAQPGRSAGTELALLVAGHVCLHSAMSGSRLASPLLALSQGYDTSSVGMLMALFALSQVFLALPAGRLADRRGLKLPVACSIVAASTGCAVAAVWPVYPVLCASAMLTGGGVGVATIALQRHVGQLAQTPARLRQAFSWFSLAPAASNFVGPLAAGFVIDSVGYGAAFALLGGVALMAWLWMRTARDLPSAQAGEPAGTAWNLWREPSFRRLMVMNWCFMASWDLHAFLVPVLGHERGLHASVIGGILGAFAVAAVLVRLVIPLVANRVREWALITIATAVTGFAFVLYPFTSTPIAMGLCSALTGLALGAVQPMVMSMLHQITPPHRHGEAVAMRILMVNATSVATPVLLGAAGGLVGVGAVFWAMGLVIGIGSGLGLRLRGTRGRH